MNHPDSPTVDDFIRANKANFSPDRKQKPSLHTSSPTIDELCNSHSQTGRERKSFSCNKSAEKILTLRGSRRNLDFNTNIHTSPVAKLDDKAKRGRKKPIGTMDAESEAKKKRINSDSVSEYVTPRKRRKCKTEGENATKAVYATYKTGSDSPNGKIKTPRGRGRGNGRGAKTGRGSSRAKSEDTEGGTNAQCITNTNSTFPSDNSRDPSNTSHAISRGRGRGAKGRGRGMNTPRGRGNGASVEARTSRGRGAQTKVRGRGRGCRPSTQSMSTSENATNNADTDMMCTIVVPGSPATVPVSHLQDSDSDTSVCSHPVVARTRECIDRRTSEKDSESEDQLSNCSFPLLNKRVRSPGNSVACSSKSAMDNKSMTASTSQSPVDNDMLDNNFMVIEVVSETEGDQHHDESSRDSCASEKSHVSIIIDPDIDQTLEDPDLAGDQTFTKENRDLTSDEELNTRSKKGSDDGILASSQAQMSPFSDSVSLASDCNSKDGSSIGRVSPILKHQGSDDNVLDTMDSCRYIESDMQLTPRSDSGMLDEAQSKTSKACVSSVSEDTTLIGNETTRSQTVAADGSKNLSQKSSKSAMDTKAKSRSTAKSKEDMSQLKSVHTAEATDVTGTAEQDLPDISSPKPSSQPWHYDSPSPHKPSVKLSKGVKNAMNKKKNNKRIKRLDASLFEDETSSTNSGFEEAQAEDQNTPLPGLIAPSLHEIGLNTLSTSSQPPALTAASSRSSASSMEEVDKIEDAKSTANSQMTTHSSHSDLDTDLDDDEELPDVLGTSRIEKDMSTIEQGDLIWIKYRTHPYWPAIVRMCYKKKKRLVKLSVMFLGADVESLGGRGHVRVTFNKHRVFPFGATGEEQHRQFKEAGLNSPLRTSFEEAIDLAEGYLFQKASGETKDGLSYFSDKFGIPCPSGYSSSSDEEENQPDVLVPPTLTPANTTDSLTEAASPPPSRSPEVDPLSPEFSTSTMASISKRSMRNQALIEHIKSTTTKEYLFKICQQKIASERHRMYCKEDKTREEILKLKLVGLGPIEEEDQENEIVKVLLEYMKELKGSEACRPFWTGYVQAVWMPEAIIYAIMKVRKVGRKKAEGVFNRGVRYSKEESEQHHREMIVNASNISDEDKERYTAMQRRANQRFAAADARNNLDLIL